MLNIIKTSQVRLFLTVLAAWMVIGMNASTIHWITFINTNDPNVGELDKNAHHTLYSQFINVINFDISKYTYNTSVEEVDSTSYEYIRMHAREKVMQFMDYYRVIADKHIDMATKRIYIQQATDLFLPDNGVVRSTITDINKGLSRKTVQSVKIFLEKVALGKVQGNPNIFAWEFCHNCKQTPLSEKVAEVTFCKHGDRIHEDRNVCIMPNGYVTCTMHPLKTKSK